MFKKIILPIAVGILLLVGIVVGIYLVRQQQDIREKAAPATSLSFTPSQDSMRVGETKVITVNIETGPNVVGAIKLNMVYDPAYLTIEPNTFVRGTFFQTQIQAPSATAGRLSMVAGGQVGNFPTGSGQVATFTVRALQAGPTVISFDSAQTEVSGTGSDRQTNVILPGGLGSSSLTILASAQPTTTPTNTPTPTSAAAAPVVTPTPTTASGGGGSNNPTTTPTPTRAAGTTATPTPTKKATSTPTKVSTGSATTLPQAGVGTTTVVFLVAGALLAIFGMLLLAL